jgi:hypothetical protein
MKSRTSLLLGCLVAVAITIDNCHALVTPSLHASPSSLTTTGNVRSQTKLGNDTGNAAATVAAEPPRGGGSGVGATESGGTATIPNEVFNLIKSIVGAGVLSLPAGMLSQSVYH